MSHTPKIATVQDVQRVLGDVVEELVEIRSTHDLTRNQTAAISQLIDEAQESIRALPDLFEKQDDFSAVLEFVGRAFGFLKMLIGG